MLRQIKRGVVQVKKFNRLAIILTVMLFFGASGWGFAQEVLRVASDATFPPFESVDPDTDECVGFDIDLIKAIGAEIGMEVEILNTAWDGILPGLINGNYDAVIAAMTITEARLEAVDFSDPYFNASQVLVVRKDDDQIKGLDDLAGKVAAVQIGTTGDLEASEMDSLKRVARFNSIPEAFLELQNKAADLAVVDMQVANDYIKNNPNSAKIVGEPFTTEHYGIAIRKGREELLTKINAGLAAVIEKGIYDEIYAKYFGVE